MQQRLQLVRAVARRVPLLLLDEPLGAVDQPRRLLISRSIRALLKQDKTATIWVTHDALEAATVADRVLLVAGRPLRVAQEKRIVRTGLQDPGLPPVENRSAIADLDAQAAELRALLMRLTVAEDTRQEAVDDQDAAPASKPSRITLLWVFPLALVVLGVWELGVRLWPNARFFASLPSEWIPVLFRELLNGRILSHLGTTLVEMTLGLVIALPMGTLIGYGASSSRTVSLAVRPYLAGLAAVPLFVLAPLFILWFGIGIEMKVALATLSALPIFAYLVHDAAITTRGMFYRYARATRGSIRRCFLHLTLPGMLEAMILGVRPAAIAALLGAFLGEFVAAERGLGYYIVLQSSRYRVPEVLAGVTLLFLIVAMIDSATRWIAAERNRIIGFWGL
jgi:NitT/TauT family transport system permease protein